MNGDDLFEGLVGDRRGHPWISEDGSPAYLQRVRQRSEPGGIYRQMLIEDLSRLVPYEYGLRKAFTARLEPTDDSLERTILQALPSFYGPARSLQDAFRTFAETCVVELLSGPVTLEIELFVDGKGARSPLFLVHPLPSATIWGRSTHPKQWLASADGSGIKRGVPYVELDPARMITFALPRPMRNALRKALSALSKADSLQQSALEMVTSDPIRSFDVNAQQKLLAAFSRRATREIGWDGRGLYTDDMLETYRLWRSLRFARFQVGVREVIVSGLQAALDRAGELTGFSTKLIIGDVLTDEILDLAEADFRAGRRSFSDLMNLTYKPLPASDEGESSDPHDEPWKQ